jgi:hypothetical protein
LAETHTLAPPPAPVIPDPELERVAVRATEQALALLRERFESGRVPDHMYYHNSAHTAGVVWRARLLGAAMGMTDRQLLLTVIAAAYHDIVQRWVEIAAEGGVVLRRRFAGRDEVASAHEAVEAMGGLGIPFGPDEKGVVASAIIATIPGWDSEAATVSQPFLIAHPIISAVAMADLGAAGMAPETYRLDGPALFAEENLDLMRAVMGARRAIDISAAAQDAYRNRYLGWLNIQPGFASGRARLLNRELEGFPDGVRERLAALMSHFEESIGISEEAVRRAKTLDFVALMRTLDARAFPDEDAEAARRI